MFCPSTPLCSQPAALPHWGSSKPAAAAAPGNSWDPQIPALTQQRLNQNLWRLRPGIGVLLSPPGSHSDRAGSLSISIKSCSFTSKSKQCLNISHCFHHLDLRKAQGIRKALPGPTLHRGSLFTPKLLCFYLFCLFVCLLICNFFPSLLPEWIATPHVEGDFSLTNICPQMEP